MSAEVMATWPWKTNAHLIEDAARLGYLQADWETLDPTYGKGIFWKRWRPDEDNLVACDLVEAKSPLGVSVDFTKLPFVTERFRAVVFDPPYKLNGTPSEPDVRYGVDVVRTWRQRHDLIRSGIRECERVLAPGGNFLLKCQDQVCSGQVRWQTFEFTEFAENHGLRLVDRFDLIGGRAQPAGRRQVHARRNTSTLLVFTKGR